MSDFDSLMNTFEVATGVKKRSKKKKPSTTPTTTPPTSAMSTNVPSSSSSQPTSPPIPTITSSLPTPYSIPAMRQESTRVASLFQIRSSLTPSKKSKYPPAKVTLAVCCCIVDAFPNEDIWRKWSNDSAPFNLTPGTVAQANFHIHAALPNSPKVSPWVLERLLPYTFAPKWNDVKIVQAVLALIETAMKDESVTHVLVVTESCVPVVDVTVAIRTLIGMEESANVATGPPYKSFMSCYTSESTKFTTFDRESVWGKLGLNGFGGDVGGVGVTVVKSLPGWTAIGRSDCEGVLEVEEECEEGLEIWRSFEGVWAPEEVYFPTVVRLANGGVNVVDRCVNYAEWDSRNPDYRKRANPVWFDGMFDQNSVRKWREGGAIVVRKFKELTVEEWVRVVQPSTAPPTTKRGREEQQDSDVASEKKVKVLIEQGGELK